MATRPTPSGPIQEEAVPGESSVTSDLRSWIQDFLRRAVSGDPLPKASDLAKRWGLSRLTVDKIVNGFRDRGQVVRIRRKGSFAWTAEPLVLSEEENLAGEAKAIGFIRRCLREGSLRRGESLPGVKALSHRLGLSPPSVTKAYRTLAKQGLVDKHGRQFRLMPSMGPSSLTGSGRLCLFLPEGIDFHRPFGSDHYGPAYMAMEAELRLHGIGLDIHPLSRLGSLRRRWGGSREYPLGLWFWKMDRNQAMALMPEIRRVLEGSKATGMKVVIDSMSSFPHVLVNRLLVLSRPRIWYYMGLNLCRHVLCSGYQEAWFCDFYRDPKRIHPFLIEQMRQLAPDFRWHVVEGLEGATDDLDAAEKALAAFSGHRSGSSQGRGRLWVAASDRCASILLQGAGRLGLKVPRDLALIGIDNDPRFCHLGISTVSPAWERLGYLMACALTGDSSVDRDREGFLRYGGRIISRDTTPP